MKRLKSLKICQKRERSLKICTAHLTPILHLSWLTDLGYAPPLPAVFDPATDFQTAIGKLRNENLESLANFQKECAVDIAALQRTVDVHGKRIKDVEESLTNTCDQLTS